MKPLLNCKQTASFNLYFVKINFSTGVGGSLSYFVEIPEGWRGGGGGWGSSVISSLQIWKIQGCGGVLSEIPSVVGYG